jgi:hypothetical protein
MARTPQAKMRRLASSDHFENLLNIEIYPSTFTAASFL